jgi:hypothetical protein
MAKQAEHFATAGNRIVARVVLWLSIPAVVLLVWMAQWELRPAPLRRRSADNSSTSEFDRGPLSREQVERALRLQQTFAEVHDQTLAEWIADLKRASDPNHDLLHWERRAKAYEQFCRQAARTPAAKQEAFGLLVAIDDTSIADALANSRRSVLTRREVEQLIQGQ